MRLKLFRLLLTYARELDAGNLILHPDCRSEHAQPLVDLLSNLLGQRADLLGILLTFYFFGESLDFGDCICLDGGDACGHPDTLDHVVSLIEPTCW